MRGSTAWDEIVHAVTLVSLLFFSFHFNILFQKGDIQKNACKKILI
jgi:hypothetical protein